jgi:hypothetical protein
MNGARTSRRLDLTQPSRPEPVDQHSGAIALLRLLIYPAYLDSSCRHRFLTPKVPFLGRDADG